MAEWLTKLSGTILNMMVAFYHHGPKGEVQDVRNKAHVPLTVANTGCWIKNRRNGRVAEGAPLLRVYRGNSIEGSNPSFSAIH